MAILKSEDMDDMSREDLIDKMEEMKLELAKERAQIKIGGVPENPGKMKEMKKTIARIKTKLSETR